MHINRVTLLGHAGRDAEIRTLQQSGDKVASFSLATTERWKRKDGEPAEATEWHRVVVYGAQVRAAKELVRKGAALLVEGRLSTRAFTDKQGRERQVTEVVVAGAQAMINVLSPRPATEGPREAGDAAESATAEAATPGAAEDEEGKGEDA